MNNNKKYFEHYNQTNSSINNIQIKSIYKTHLILENNYYRLDKENHDCLRDISRIKSLTGECEGLNGCKASLEIDVELGSVEFTSIHICQKTWCYSKKYGKHPEWL